jgi:hypothetical protein
MLNIVTYHFSDIYDVLDGVVQTKIDEFNEELIETLTNKKLPNDYIKMFKE